MSAITVNLNGHNMFLRSALLKNDLEKGVAEITEMFSDLVEMGDASFNVNHHSIALLIADDYRCRDCGKTPDFEIDGDRVYAQTPCEYVDEDTVTTIKVTSGKIAVSDDLRPIFDVSMDGVDYNSPTGQSTVTKRYAELNVAYGAVGNTCPDLYRVDAQTLVIANPAWDDDAEKKSETDHAYVPPLKTYPTAQSLANICTDLWAYSIADYDEYVNAGGDPDNVEVVEVPNGSYTFHLHTTTSKHYENSDDDETDTIFATIKYIP